MSAHTEELARKRKLLAEIEALIRAPYLSYNETVRRIAELLDASAHRDGKVCE